jgi:hypothetical protein
MAGFHSLAGSLAKGGSILYSIAKAHNAAADCKRSLTEIDFYGELLVGCMDCNRWGKSGDKKLVWNCRKMTLRRYREAREADTVSLAIVQLRLSSCALWILTHPFEGSCNRRS